MTDEPFENAEAEIAQDDEEQNDALLDDAQQAAGEDALTGDGEETGDGEALTPDADDVPSQANEAHPNEDDIAEAREAAE